MRLSPREAGSGQEVEGRAVQVATPGAARGAAVRLFPLPPALSHSEDTAAPQEERREVRGEERPFSEHTAAPFEHKEQVISALNYFPSWNVPLALEKAGSLAVPVSGEVSPAVCTDAGTRMHNHVHTHTETHNTAHRSHSLPRFAQCVRPGAFLPKPGGDVISAAQAASFKSEFHFGANLTKRVNLPTS